MLPPIWLGMRLGVHIESGRTPFWLWESHEQLNTGESHSFVRWRCAYNLCGIGKTFPLLWCSSKRQTWIDTVSWITIEVYVLTDKFRSDR